MTPKYCLSQWIIDQHCNMAGKSTDLIQGLKNKALLAGEKKILMPA